MAEQFDTLIRGGHVVSSQGVIRADVGIAGKTITAVGDLSQATATRVIPAQSLHILPGLIDTQVHFRDPGLTHKEDIESGSRSAVMGGVTTYFEMPNTVPNTTTELALKDKVDSAAGRSWANYSFFVGASHDNIADLGRLEMLPGTPGVKIFVGSSTGSLLVEDQDELEAVLRNGTRPTPIHSEDEARLRDRRSLISDQPHPREHPFLRDAEAAKLSTARMIDLCRKTGRPIHILHISTADELPLLRAAKDEGLPVTCEVTPQHLTLDSSAYETLGTLIQMNPPIRDIHHRDAIRQAMRDDLFDVFGSDHAPHTKEEKALPYPKSPSGIPGVQTMLGLLLRLVESGDLSLEKLARMGSERPAELYGVAKKGKIAPGYDADIVLIDLAAQQPVNQDWLQSKCGWSPFEGQTLPGKISHVWVNGREVVDHGRIVGEPAGQPVTFGWKAP